MMIGNNDIPSTNERTFAVTSAPLSNTPELLIKNFVLFRFPYQAETMWPFSFGVAKLC
jgi:hypothetical protein